jgi:hypothetical protein
LYARSPIVHSASTSGKSYNVSAKSLNRDLIYWP